MAKKKTSEWRSPGKYTPCSIGGQALLEGVMMRGATCTAVCCRDEKGELVVYTERAPAKKRLWRKVPIVRGVVSFFSSLVGGIRYIGKSADIYAGEEDDDKLGKGGMFLAVLFALVLAVALFIVVPGLLNWLVMDLWLGLSEKLDGNIYILVISLFKGVIKVLILVLYLFLTSRLKDIRRTYMYHGAEHRTINCYEHNMELTVENVQKCSTRHARCGTTFLFYTVFLSVLVMALVTWLLSLAGLTADSMSDAVGKAGTFLYNLALMGAGLCCVPVIAGLSYELLRFVAKMPDNAFFMIFKAPGFALQALTTKKPDDGMAEAAIVAFEKVLEMEADPSVPTVDFYEMTMKDARAYLQKTYAAAGIEDESEPDWMLCAVLGVKRTELAHIAKLDKEQTLRLKKYAEERASGMPLDYVAGESDFLGIKLKVNEAVHLPRMETETVALEAEKAIKAKKNARVLDLMTGSGCIAAYLSSVTDADITASDVDEAALEVARGNLPDTVKTMRSDVLSEVNGTFDVIVSNPPYIRSGEIDGLQKEVTCQPRISLDGGEDGLKYYRLIAEQAPAGLNDGGVLVLEIGFDQAADVVKLLENGFTDIKVIKDLGGRDRCVTAVKK